MVVGRRPPLRTKRAPRDRVPNLNDTRPCGVTGTYRAIPHLLESVVIGVIQLAFGNYLPPYLSLCFGPLRVTDSM